jgi:hypothetical protein
MVKSDEQLTFAVFRQEAMVEQNCRKLVLRGYHQIKIRGREAALCPNCDRRAADETGWHMRLNAIGLANPSERHKCCNIFRQ